MRSRFLFFVVLAVATCAAGNDPTPANPPPAEAPRSKFVFSLLPKSLQRKPSLDFHVITEMTAEGRKLTPATAERPVYYLAQAGKFTQLGTNVVAGEHPPPVEDLDRAIQKALATTSYLPATPSTPMPAIAVVFNYGSFARFSTDAEDMQVQMMMDDYYQNLQAADPNAPNPGPFIVAGDDRPVGALLPMVLSSPQHRTDILQRAELIGGEKFAHELAKALEQEAINKQAAGGSSPLADDMTSPFNRFMNANDRLMGLVEDSFSSCYFVVASAYDYVAMKKGKKVLLWRTKMTVNSIGIAMRESLPPLLAAAGPYLGRDMTDAVTLTRQISREGKVLIGTPTVVDDSAAPPPAPPGKKSPPPKP